MMRNNSPDPEMERRLRDHFAAEEPDLHAPDDMWDRLEGQLGEQQPPRLSLLRGGLNWTAERPWLATAAAAVLVLAIGVTTWSLIGGGDGVDGDDAEMAASVATTSETSSSAATTSSSSATTTAAGSTDTTTSSVTTSDSASDEASDGDAGETLTLSDSASSDRAESAATAEPEPTQTAARVLQTPPPATSTPPAATVTQPPATATPPPASASPVATTATPPPASASPVATAEPTPAPAVVVPPSATPTPAPVVAVPPRPATPDSDSSSGSNVVSEPDAGDGVAPPAEAAPADAVGDDAADGMADGDTGGFGGDPDPDDAMGATAVPQPVPTREPTLQALQAPQRQQPTETTFEDYERTAFVETSTDAVSTFSLDTDRTSYFLALNWARNGYTVNPDSVRAEEWTNAFDYGYSEPGDDRSFAITSDVVRHPLDADRHLARIAFQAPEFRDDTPLNVTLVLDASGSMRSGNRVAIAREAAETIRQSLSADDRLAVVHFSTDVLDRLTVAHSAPDDADVVRSITRLAAHDTTNVQAGLDLGVELADAARRERPDAFNYIILMSDGVANVDATDPFAILESASDSDSSNPLRLITVGVGIENYNDVLLEQLAQHGNGWYRYLDDTTQARTTFSREKWLALSTPFADQTRAQVTWDPTLVRSWRIVGYENRVTPDHTFEQNRKEFAELPAGAATTVFYELELWSNAGLPQALGSVEVRWVEPASGESRSQTAQVSDRTDVSFGAGDHLLRLGAIVGLAADRYSRLSTQVEGQTIDAADVHADLAALQRELDAIAGRLGSTEAYRDFDFLLDAITDAAEALAPSSGYSR